MANILSLIGAVLGIFFIFFITSFVLCAVIVSDLFDKDREEK